MASHLRSVQPGEKKRAAHKDITSALEGSSRDVMAAMRRALAKKIDAGEVSSNAIASAYKELRELDRLIRVADAEEAAESEVPEEHDLAGSTFDPEAI